MNDMSSIPPDGDAPALQDPATALSKRAARRIIQRTLVLMGKNKALRQLIRESQLTTVWSIEDWDMEWTVLLHRGKFEYERRQSKQPDATLIWPSAELFFGQVDNLKDVDLHAQISSQKANPHFYSTLLRGFFSTLRLVLEDPVDAVGQNLL